MALGAVCALTAHALVVISIWRPLPTLLVRFSFPFLDICVTNAHTGSHPPWFADSQQRNAFFLADWQSTGGLTEYLNSYHRWPDPAPLPNYIPAPIGTRWDNEPIPPMLAFTENAVAYATQLERTEGDDRVANFHSTGVHVDASAGYVNWLDDEGRKRGSLDFMLRQGMHSLGLLPSFFNAFSDEQARSRWLYKPRHVPEDPTDKQEPMHVDAPATQEEDDEDDVQVGPQRRARRAYKSPVSCQFQF